MKDASYAIEAVEKIDKYIDEHLANAHDMKDSNPDKKYYRGWDDALGEMSGILQDVYSNEKRKEDKPSIFPPGLGYVRWNPISSAEWSYPYGRNETADRLVSLAECLEMDGDYLFNGYSGTECGKFLRELARKQVECKPAEEHYDLTEILVPPQLPQNNQWSEEDEAKKERLISIVKRALQGNKYPLLNNDGATELIDWLKSLQPQPKQEWDELQSEFRSINEAFEDGKKEVIEHPEEYDLCKPTKFGSLEYERGVKDGIQHSENHRWKPSEEQMETLKSCFHINPATGEPHSPSLDEIYMLGSLYNDLKRL